MTPTGLPKMASEWGRAGSYKNMNFADKSGGLPKMASEWGRAGSSTPYLCV
uniref:Uncharacterized protein n=1 Tax=Fagus sylvatica TaxID=28930 RepID=A0A2N9FC27_FAGSY